MKFFQEHPNTTQNPQSFLIHLNFAVKNSLLLIWIGFIGLFHAFLPGIRWMQCYTSTRIIKIFIRIVKSERHMPELQFAFKNEKIHIIYDRE